MPVSDLSEFHRWLFAARSSSPGAIVLHGPPCMPTDLATSLARYLNEFDEDARGLWKAFTPELIQEIAGSPQQCRLLGLAEICANDACGRKKVFAALARRGFAVLEGSQALGACASLDHAFRVSLGSGEPDVFHLCLKPEWFNLRALPAIIGDTYLEWLATRTLVAPA